MIPGASERFREGFSVNGAHHSVTSGIIHKVWISTSREGAPRLWSLHSPGKAVGNVVWGYGLKMFEVWLLDARDGSAAQRAKSEIYMEKIETDI